MYQPAARSPSSTRVVWILPSASAVRMTCQSQVDCQVSENSRGSRPRTWSGDSPPESGGGGGVRGHDPQPVGVAMLVADQGQHRGLGAHPARVGAGAAEPAAHSAGRYPQRAAIRR
jgi:hypothetical protein